MLIMYLFKTMIVRNRKKFKVVAFYEEKKSNNSQIMKSRPFSPKKNLLDSSFEILYTGVYFSSLTSLVHFGKILGQYQTKCN